MKKLISCAIFTLLTNFILHGSSFDDSYLKSMKKAQCLSNFKSMQNVYDNYEAGEKLATSSAISALSTGTVIGIQKYLSHDKKSALAPIMIGGLASLAFFSIARLNYKSMQRVIHNCSTDFTPEEIETISQELRFTSGNRTFLNAVRNQHTLQQMYRQFVMQQQIIVPSRY